MLFNIFLLLVSAFHFIGFGRKLCLKSSMNLLIDFGNLNGMVFCAEQNYPVEPRLKYYFQKLLVVVLFLTRGNVLALRVWGFEVWFLVCSSLRCCCFSVFIIMYVSGFITIAIDFGYQQLY